MKSRLVFPLLAGLVVGGLVFAISMKLAEEYLIDIYIQYPEMQSLTMGVLGAVAILVFLLAYSLFQPDSAQTNEPDKYSKLVSWIAIIGILVISLVLGRISINTIAKNSTASWETVEVTPAPYVSSDFVKLFGSESMLGCENCDHISVGVITIKGDRQRTLDMHPRSQASFEVLVPAGARLAFSIALAPAVWQIGMGDGVQFSVNVDAGSGVKNIFRVYIDPKNLAGDRDWLDYEVDLAEWVGEKIILIFATSPGPNNDDRYDWASWGEPRIEPAVVYNFLDNLSNAQIELINPEFGQANKSALTINNKLRNILYQHPSSRVTYTLSLPPSAILQFGLGMSEEVWSPEKGDGVEYNIYVRNLYTPDILYQVFQKTVDSKNNPDDRQWLDEEIDLSKFGGQSVEIIFEALPGPANNYDFDWGGWSDPVLLAASAPTMGRVGESQP